MVIAGSIAGDDREMMIPYGRHEITDADRAAILAVLDSDFITQGPAIERFEEELAQYCGSKHALAVSSATAGLHLAVLAAGADHAKSVWTSPNTFVASANSALYTGARIDFVDINPHTLNLDVEQLRRKLNQGTRPDILIPVHFGGHSADMRAIASIAEQEGMFVIEDAAHAIGGRYLGRAIGNCQFSDVCVFSLHPVKIITSGEGGVITTNNTELYDSMKRLRSHGVVRSPELLHDNTQGSWYYEQQTLGYNYRITDIQAALGASQLGRVDEYVLRRSLLADRYDSLLEGLPLQRPHRSADVSSSWHLYAIVLDQDINPGGAARRFIFDRMRSAGIGVNVHYIPVHTHPFYRDLGFHDGDFPCAEAYYKGAITLPLFPRLTHGEQDFVIRTLRDALSALPRSGHS